MPRRSPFSIELSREELQTLEAQARRYTLPYRDVIRAKIVLMAAQGMDNDEIALRLDTRREIVSKWRKRFFEERLPGLEERPRQGRPGVFPPRGGRRGQSHRVPAPERARPPPEPPPRPRHPPGGPAARPRGGDLRNHDLALALRRPPSAPGPTAAGSSPATPSSRPRRGRCWISTLEPSTASGCAATSTWSRRTRCRPSRRSPAATRPTWRRGMSTGRGSGGCRRSVRAHLLARLAAEWSAKVRATMLVY